MGREVVFALRDKENLEFREGLYGFCVRINTSLTVPDYIAYVSRRRIT